MDRLAEHDFGGRLNSADTGFARRDAAARRAVLDFNRPSKPHSIKRSMGRRDPAFA